MTVHEIKPVDTIFFLKETRIIIFKPYSINAMFFNFHKL